MMLGGTEEHLTAGLAIMIAFSKEKKMSIGSSVALFLICGFTALALAQAPPEPPKPGPEHKKLEYFLGTWKTEGEIEANEFLPAGKVVTTETYTLGPGGFYVEFDRPEGQIPRTQGIMATTAMRSSTRHSTRAVPDSWVAVQERLTETLGRGCLKTNGLAKHSKEERQSPSNRPLSSRSSMNISTRTAVM